MTATIVFIHGRAQEAKDPATLLTKWRAGLSAGLVLAGLPPMDGTPAAFPYYGDLLYRVTADIARRGERVDLEELPTDPADAGPFHPHLTADVGALERRLLADMADAAGAPLAEEEGLLEGVLSWGAARRALTWVAHNTRVDREIIKAHLRDVAVYLARAREQVLDVVRASLPADGPLVLVAHSLGTVVARDLLDDPDVRARTAAWLTAGSPLGLRTVQRNLRTEGAVNPGRPWLSPYDVTDIVALGHPLEKQWGQPLRDLRVANGDAPHSIARYLGHAEVARFVHDAVAGA